MIRLMFLAAVLAVAMSGGTVHAKMVVQTFPVLAGAGVHDVFPAPDGTVWFTAQSAGKLGRLDPRTGKSDLNRAGSGCGTPRRDRCARQCRLGHRRWAERDRPDRSRDPC